MKQRPMHLSAVTLATAASRRHHIDIPAVARAARQHALELCRRWLPGGQLVGREWTCGSLRGEAGRSCRVNTSTGRWCDFATGVGGGDLVSLCAAIHGLRQIEAARRLALMMGMEGVANER